MSTFGLSSGITRLYLLTLQGERVLNVSFKVPCVDLVSFFTYRQDKLYKQEEEKYNPAWLKAPNWKLHVVAPQVITQPTL